MSFLILSKSPPATVSFNQVSLLAARLPADSCRASSSPSRPTPTTSQALCSVRGLFRPALICQGLCCSARSRPRCCWASMLRCSRRGGSEGSRRRASLPLSVACAQLTLQAFVQSTRGSQDRARLRRGADDRPARSLERWCRRTLRCARSRRVGLTRSQRFSARRSETRRSCLTERSGWCALRELGLLTRQPGPTQWVTLVFAIVSITLSQIYVRCSPLARR